MGGGCRIAIRKPDAIVERWEEGKDKMGLLRLIDWVGL